MIKLDWKIYAMVAVAVAMAATYWVGMRQGESNMRIKAEKELTAQLKERGVTDDEINEMDPDGVCGLLGGVLVNGVCQ